MTTWPEFGPSGDTVRLRELIKLHGALGPEPALVVFRESLVSLAAIRKDGPAHWAYQPENVLVDHYGGSTLAGFDLPAGTAGRVPAELAAYQAPDLHYGAPVRWTSDVYAATAVFFECFTGLMPSPQQIRQFGLAGPLRDLIEWGMAADPADRPASAGQLVAELDRMAVDWWGPGWYRRGRRELAERVADTLAPARNAAGSAGTSSPARNAARSAGTSSPTPGRRDIRARVLVAGVAAAAGVVLGVAGTGAAFSGYFGSKPPHSGPSVSLGAPSRPAFSSSTARPPAVETGGPPGGLAAATADASITPATTPPAPSPSRNQLTISVPITHGAMLGTVGKPFSATPTAKNGIGRRTWSAAGLPPGVAINASTGTVSGIPTAAGGYSSRITVTDAGSPAQSATAGVAFLVAFPQMEIAAPRLPHGTVGAAYPRVKFAAAGGNGTCSWFIAPGTTLPAGMSLSATGVLSGTPRAAGTFAIRVSASDAIGGFASTRLTLVINRAKLPPEDPGWPPGASGQWQVAK